MKSRRSASFRVASRPASNGPANAMPLFFAAPIAAAVSSAAALAALAPAAYAGNVFEDGSYFVNNTITNSSGDIPSSDSVFVGKDDATDFATVLTPVTLNLGAGTDINPGFTVALPEGNPAALNYYGLNMFGTSETTLNGGSVSAAFAYDSSTFNISGGSATYTGAYGNSTVNVNGSGDAASLQAFDSASVDMTGGTSEGIDGIDANTIDISGGSVTQLEAIGTSNAAFSGGEIEDSIVSAGATMDVTDSAVFDVLEATGGGVLDVSGGSAGTGSATFGLGIENVGGTVDVTGGDFGSAFGLFDAGTGGMSTVSAGSMFEDNLQGNHGTLNLSGTQSLGYLIMEGNEATGSDEVANVSSGTVSGGVSLVSPGDVLNISGGNFTGAVITGNAGTTINVTGGIGVADGYIASSGTVNFFGSGLTVTDLGGDEYTVTGTLDDGSTLDATFFGTDEQPKFGKSGVSFSAASPEPGSLPLLGVTLTGAGLVACAARRRRSPAAAV